MALTSFPTSLMSMMLRLAPSSGCFWTVPVNRRLYGILRKKQVRWLSNGRGLQDSEMNPMCGIMGQCTIGHVDFRQHQLQQGIHGASGH